jgi:predicted nucleotidyltransferase
MNRQAILDRLNAEAPGLKRKYGAKSLAVFGSMARGDDHEGSDVDFIVTFEGLATSRRFMDLKLESQDLFDRRVDLLTPRSLSPRMQVEVAESGLPGTGNVHAETVESMRCAANHDVGK